MNSPRSVRQPEWAAALAVGSEGFVNADLKWPGARARGRRIQHPQQAEARAYMQQLMQP
jgi:hypothetical protein